MKTQPLPDAAAERLRWPGPRDRRCGLRPAPVFVPRGEGFDPRACIAEERLIGALFVVHALDGEVMRFADQLRGGRGMRGECQPRILPPERP